MTLLKKHFPNNSFCIQINCLKDITLRQGGLVIRSAILVCAIFTFFGSFSEASRTTAEEYYNKAVDFFAQREEMAKTDLAIDQLSKAESLVANNGELKFQILLLSARANYWRGVNTEDRDKRIAFFYSALSFGQKLMDLRPDLSEGFYFKGIGLGRWAESKGGTESLAKKNEIMSLINEALSRETAEGNLGQELDGYGPDRTLGRMYFRLPSFAGGSLEKSAKHLKIAVSGGGAVALNFVYYAETLIDIGGSSKQEGCKILNDLLKVAPEVYNANRIPETKREMALGLALKNSSCK